MSRSNHSGLGQDFEQPLAIETSFLTKDHSLSDRLHAYTQQRVDDQLHSCPRAGAAQKMELFCDRLEDWLSSAEEFPVAACQQRQGAFLGGRSAAGDGNIHYFDANSGAELVQFA